MKPPTLCALGAMVLLASTAAAAQEAGEAPSHLAIAVHSLREQCAQLCDILAGQPRTLFQYRLQVLRNKLELLDWHFTYSEQADSPPTLEDYLIHDIGGQIDEIELLAVRHASLTVQGEQRWRILVATWDGHMDSLALIRAAELERRAGLLAAALRAAPGAESGAPAELADQLAALSSSIVNAQMEPGPADSKQADLVARLVSLADQASVSIEGDREQTTAFLLSLDLARSTRAFARLLEGRQRQGELMQLPDAPWADSSLAGNRPPVGALTSCTERGIEGWAYDPDRPNQPLLINVVVNGRVFRTITANLYSSEQERRPGEGGRNHGFYLERLELEPGESTVDVYAIDADDASQHLIGSGQVDVPQSR